MPRAFDDPNQNFRQAQDLFWWWYRSDRAEHVLMRAWYQITINLLWNVCRVKLGEHVAKNMFAKCYQSAAQIAAAQGGLAEQAGDKSTARKWYQAAVKYLPNDPAINTALARLTRSGTHYEHHKRLAYPPTHQERQLMESLEKEFGMGVYFLIPYRVLTIARRHGVERIAAGRRNGRRQTERKV